MKLKTYKTTSLQEGLEDIKRDLGGDALILSTRSVSVRPPFSLFKKPAWEITAVLEEKPAVAAPAPARPALGTAYERAQATVGVETMPRLADRRQSTAAAAAVAPAPIQRDQRMDTLLDEISELKKSF